MHKYTIFVMLSSCIFFPRIVNFKSHGKNFVKHEMFSQNRNGEFPHTNTHGFIVVENWVQMNRLWT